MAARPAEGAGQRAAPTPASALILSGSLGKGHDVVAEACAAALTGRGAATRIVDSMALLGGPAGAVGEAVFRRLLSVPAVYDGFHFSQLRTGGRAARFADGAALRTMYPRFLAQVAETRPGLILSVFATGAAAGARYKAEWPAVTTAVFMTDSFAHRMWVHEGTDLFLVTSELAASSVRLHRPRAKVAVVDAPVRPAFYDAPDRAAARRALGVPGDARCVLVMSGAWGIGPLDRAAEELAARGLWVLAVAGSNAALAARLDRVAARRPQVRAFGFTDRVPELMAAADVVVTSSGDTCREARVVGRGIVLLDVVPGHGRENLMHELELGGAAATASDPATLAEAVEVFLERPEGGRHGPAIDPRRWEGQFLAALADVGFDPRPGIGPPAG